MKFNTRIIAHEFDYLAPESLQEALDILSHHGDQAAVLAGGTDVVGHLKRNKATPAVLVDIKRIPELKVLESGGHGYRIGATNSFRRVMECFRRDTKHFSLFEAIHGIGKTQVLNMGTVGGNIANGSPKADTAPPLLTFDARVKLVSPRGERTVPMVDFFKRPNRTDRAADEILCEIQFDAFGHGQAGAFEKRTRVGADISKISCAVAVTRDGDRCTDCRIVLGATGPTPLRMRDAEALLTGQTIGTELVETAVAKVHDEVRPPTRGRIRPETRRHLAGVMFRDVFWSAWQRTGGKTT